MANRIQLKRGIKSKLPTLTQGEPAYTTDTHELYVGTGGGNVNMGGTHWYSGTDMTGTGNSSYSACPLVKLGDMYLNTSSGNVYECTTAGSGTSAKWTYRGCLKGAAGAQGATGAQGPKGDTGPQGPQGPAGTTAAKLTTPRGIDGVDFDGSKEITHYGVCSTPAATAAKTVDIPGFKLVTGAVVLVKFTNTNTASNPTLNVNSTVAKTMYSQTGYALKGNELTTNIIYMFVFDGSYYRLVAARDRTSGQIVAIGGSSVTADGTCSVAVGGELNNADGMYSTCIGGMGNHALHFQTKIGVYSTDGTTDDYFIIGNGSYASTSRSNAFRVDSSGRVYAKSAVNSTGADYAELFEWLDGNPENEDRIGLFVTLDGEKIRLANADDDYILGAISGMPGVVGNNHSETWQGMWLTDIYGRVQKHTVHLDAEYDDDGNVIREECDIVEPIINPDYNPDEKYVPREERKEWGIVGMMGQLIVIDDGTCEVNGNCTVGDGGTATASESGWRVIARIDDTHVKVLFR